jgi:hypothetical protein
VLKYGKLKEFSTFQHDKQTTSNYSVSLKTKRVYCPAKPVHLKQANTGTIQQPGIRTGARWTKGEGPYGNV